MTPPSVFFGQPRIACYDMRSALEREAGRIRIREKQIFLCSFCKNKYDRFHYFCPQCLSSILPQSSSATGLRIAMWPEDKKSEILSLLKNLSGPSEFIERKQAPSLPWQVIYLADLTVVEEWQKVLEGCGCLTEVTPVTARPRRQTQPSFGPVVSFPCFLPHALTERIRRSARRIQIVALRLKWNQTVAAGYHLLRSLYTDHASQRVVFSDFILELEHKIGGMLDRLEQKNLKKMPGRPESAGHQNPGNAKRPSSGSRPCPGAIMSIRITSPEEDRYHRLRIIQWWDQEKLKKANVLVVGAGALGNEVVKNLALLGIGRVWIVDFDLIETSNLTRSVLFRSQDVGQPKAKILATRAAEINPDSTFEPLLCDARYDLGLGFLRGMNLIFGCLDNREARYYMNRYCSPPQASDRWRAGYSERFRDVVSTTGDSML
jgi:hypothetical protein